MSKINVCLFVGFLLGCGADDSKKSSINPPNQHAPDLPPKKNPSPPSSGQIPTLPRILSSPETIFLNLEKSFAQIKNENFKFDTRLEILENLETENLVECDQDQKKIIVNMKQLSKIEETVQEQWLKISILHQLGHCEFERDYDDQLITIRTDSSQRKPIDSVYSYSEQKPIPKSLMWKNLNFKDLENFEASLDDYLRELINPNYPRKNVAKSYSLEALDLELQDLENIRYYELYGSKIRMWGGLTSPEIFMEEVKVRTGLNLK